MVTRVIQYFCFPGKPMKGGDILDFQKGGNLRKKGGYDPPCQLWESCEQLITLYFHLYKNFDHQTGQDFGLLCGTHKARKYFDHIIT